ncbi:MAG TPA: MFS transporter [Streptosporangiales bacterium]
MNSPRQATGTRAVDTARPPLVTRALLLRFVSVIGSSVSFFLPLSVVPMYAKSAGSDAGAGLATAALLLTTVAVELVTPRLVSALGYRWSLTIGLVLLGAPALALLAPPDPALVIAVSMVRGAGFAVVTVAGGALTAALIPVERRGEGLGLMGIVSGVPSLVALPAGVWVSAHHGFAPVFVATAAAALLALVVVPALPGPAAATDHASGVAARLRDRAVVRLSVVFGASTTVAGVIVTFLPLAVTGRSAALAATALFAQPAAATLARWLAGRLGDRVGHRRLLCPGVLASAAGMAAVAAVHTPVLVVGGAAVFGVGFGLLQNASLALMYARVPETGYSAVSAIWNAAYDAGMGVGALGIGLVVGFTGYPVAFLSTAALAVLALLPAYRLFHDHEDSSASWQLEIFMIMESERHTR